MRSYIHLIERSRQTIKSRWLKRRFDARIPLPGKRVILYESKPTHSLDSRTPKQRSGGAEETILVHVRQTKARHLEFNGGPKNYFSNREERSNNGRQVK